MPTEAPAHNPAYTSNGDGTIVDNVTKLVWQQVGSSETSGWAAAMTYCAAQNTGGYRDWRLPTQIELISIFDYSSPNGVLNPVFSGPVDASYWTSSPSSIAGNAWMFGSAGNSMSVDFDATANIRCVR